MPRQQPAREHQGVLEVRALDDLGVQARELHRPQQPGVVGEPDQMDRVLRELRVDQGVQRQRRRLRHPPGAPQRHRVGQVHQQADDRGGAAFGLGHLEVADVQLDHPVRAAGAGPQHRVAHGAYHIDRLCVTEVPRSGRPGGFSGGTGVPGVVIAAAAGVHPLEDARQRALADAADRPRGQLQLAGVAGQEALALQLLLDLLEGTQVVNGVPAQRPGDRVRVDVLEGRPGIVLGQRGGELVELGQLLQDGSRVT